MENSAILLIRQLLKVVPDSKAKIFIVSNGKKVYKRILRSRLVYPLLERYVLSQITKINDHPKPELGVLVLDSERFWPGELERLGEMVQLYKLPSRCKHFLHALFFSVEEQRIIQKTEGVCKVTEIFKVKKKRFISFLRKLILHLASKIGFKCIVTCNYMYLQNKLIAKACKETTTIRFVDLSRESKQDVNLNKRFKEKYKTLELCMDFFGNAICVYNENMRNLLCELAVCPSQNIHVVGALRTDLLIKKLRQAKQNSNFKQVTLFSFRHMPIGGDGKGYHSGFSHDEPAGYVRLFDAVHSAFAELANRHKDVKFVVKTKWRGVWHDCIKKAIEKSGFSLDNIIIMGEEGDAIENILKSTVVIGLNSMTLVQARLAGKVTIIPVFEELVDKYPDTLQYRDNLSEFIVANSREKLMQLVEKYLKEPVSIPSKPTVFDRYIGFTDGKNLERVMAILR